MHSGVGWLAETDFQWSENHDELITPPEQTSVNWVGIGADGTEPPYFDWYIKA